MSTINRREFVISGTGFSALALFAQNAAPHGIEMGQDSDPLADVELPPRERLLFESGWSFVFGHSANPVKDLGFGNDQGDFAKTGDFNFSKTGYEDSKWRALDLPHDWAVELPFVNDEELKSHGYKPLGRRYPETSVGWYRREFEIPIRDKRRRISVEFDGVFRSVLVFVNGCFIGRNDNGYASFELDLTDFLLYGARNCIALRVDASFGDGWFYEGAVIYRHVWLTKTSGIHLDRLDSTVRSELNGETATLDLATVVKNDGQRPAIAKIVWRVVDRKGALVTTAEAAEQLIAKDGRAPYSASTKIANPALWSPNDPNLYSLVLTVEVGGKVLDTERIRVITESTSQLKEMRSGGSYLSQDDLRLHFGLGADDRMNRIDVLWPDGNTETFLNLEADHFYRLVEDRKPESVAF